MTDDDPTTHDHLMASADDLNDALTSLDRAITESEVDDVTDIIKEMRGVTSELEAEMRQLAVNAEVMEGDDA